ncbi:helix-turn-helix domain-containing protein [Carnobacterium gallinarum]|uniref:helix-turn-helix domain-containing protein n=1 Tax=Carnobacterium gallinarum TaxID=2749 RepID=UPI000554852A|nr:helix-turn-helix domain-containing protein [Carnobacterium gallinarum]
MEQFWDKISLRKMKILNYLNLKKKSVYVRELTEYIGCTDKTLFKAMDLLEQDLKRWNAEIKLIRIGKFEFKLEKENYFSLDIIKLEYLKESYIFKAFDEIFQHKFGDITTFSNNNYISYSVVYSRFNELKPFLEKFDLDFKANSRYQLEGSEKQIRYFYILFYWSSYLGMEEWPFTEVKKEELVMFVEEIEKMRRRPLGIAEKEVVYFWLAVIFTRIKLGCFIEEFVSEKAIIEEIAGIGDLKKQALDMLKFSTDMPPDFSQQIIENELTFLILVLYSCEYYQEDSLLVEELVSLGKKNTSLIYQSADYWIQTLTKVFSIKLTVSEYEVAYANLVHLHTRVSVFKGGNYLFFDENQFQKDWYLEEEFSDMVERFYNELLKEPKFIEIFSHKEELLSNYVSLIHQFFDETKLFKPVKVHIISIYGGIATKHYGDLIQQSSYEQLIIENQLKPDLDLVISDRMYPGLKELTIPILIWDTVPKKEDIHAAKLQVRKIRLEKLEISRNKKKKSNQIRE